MSVWMNPASMGEDGYGRVMEKANHGDATQGWVFMLDSHGNRQTPRLEVAHTGNIGA